MKKRRLFIVIVVILAISVFLWIQFFEVPNKMKISEANIQENPETHDFEKVLEYENAFMGNASNTIHLFGNLPLSQRVGTFEMDSDTFLLIINYSYGEDESERMVQQSVIYNTTAAFVLIKNMQQVEMRFPNESFIVHAAM